jgi:hypothetical protein
LDDVDFWPAVILDAPAQYIHAQAHVQRATNTPVCKKHCNQCQLYDPTNHELFILGSLKGTSGNIYNRSCACDGLSFSE